LKILKFVSKSAMPEGKELLKSGVGGNQL